MDFKTLGTDLRKLRLRRQFTQKEVANRMGVTDAYVSQIERGIGRIPIDQLEDYAKACGATVRLLVVAEDDTDQQLLMRLQAILPKLSFQSKMTFAAALGLLEATSGEEKS